MENTNANWKGSRMEDIKYLYLIRHGESNHNSNGNAFSGISDVDLTQEGINQAASLRNSIYIDKIDEVYTSNLIRAKKTAKLIFGETYPIKSTNLLREINFGTYEGKVFLPEDAESDEIYYRWLSHPGDLVFPNGDSISVHTQTCYHNFLHIMQQSEAKKIAFVTHSTTIRLFIAKVLGLDLNYFRNIPCSNCSITILSFQKDIFKLIRLNI
jgi:broad specificity phosphatase PhoE